MSEVLRLLSDALPSRRFRRCEALLPVDEWCVVPGRLRFGMPWPWTMSDSHIELVDSTGGATATTDPIATVFAPRSDGAVTLGLWRDAGELESVLPRIGRDFAATYHGTLRAERRILLGGSKSVLIELDVGRDRVWRLVADWAGHLLHGEMDVPAASADGYAAHLETMLATWSWH
jgi:hypothetical protein